MYNDTFLKHNIKVKMTFFETDGVSFKTNTKCFYLCKTNSILFKSKSISKSSVIEI